MSMESNIVAIANDEFEEWADRRHLTLFDRAPYRSCWIAAYQAGYQLAVGPLRDADGDDFVDPEEHSVADV